MDIPAVKNSPVPTIQNDPLGENLAKKIATRPDLLNLGKSLKEAASGLTGPGIKGPGHDGGAGGGDGGGVGKKPGIGSPASNRAPRMQRWEMLFTINDARHYLQQLDALGAIVAVPDRTGRLMTIRNLRERPARPQLEDVRALNRIFWVDDRPESAESVAAELGLELTPSAIVAFFPYSLEEELVRKETAYRNRAEADIEYTKFAITFSGGRHVIRVVEQRARPGRK
jgi:hypothetical protein